MRELNEDLQMYKDMTNVFHTPSLNVNDMCKNEFARKKLYQARNSKLAIYAVLYN